MKKNSRNKVEHINYVKIKFSRVGTMYNITLKNSSMH